MSGSHFFSILFGKHPSKWVAAGYKGCNCTCHFLVKPEAKPWPEAIAAEFLMSPVWLGSGIMQMQIFISNMLVLIEAASIVIPQKNKEGLDSVIISC